MNDDKFDRGSALTIFKTDRHEDIAALVLAFAIAIAIYLFV